MKDKIYKTLVMAVLATLIRLEPLSAAEAKYRISDFGEVLGPKSYAQAINNRGEVAGYWDTGTNGVHAFLYSQGFFTDLGSLGGTNRYALNINAIGQIVGFSETDEGMKAFLFSGGTMRNVGTFWSGNSYAFGINGSGQIVGHIDTAEGSRAFLLDGDLAATFLGTLGGTNSFAFGINSARQVAGASQDAQERMQAFVWANGTLANLNALIPVALGWDLRDARGINDEGAIVGWGIINGAEHAFLFSKGLVTDLGALRSAESSYALGLNNKSQVVGGMVLQNGVRHAFIWDQGAIKDLNDVIPAGSGWELREALGINDFGQIVGWGVRQGQERAFLLDEDSLAEPKAKSGSSSSSGISAKTSLSRDTSPFSILSGGGGPVTNSPLADAHVQDGGSANSNFGTNTVMQLQTSATSGNNRDVYFMFDISNAPVPIGSAKLRVFAALSGNGSVTTTAFSVSDTNWTETGITWNTRPSLGTALSNQTFNVKAGASYDINITSFIQAEQNAGRSIISVALHCTNNVTLLTSINSRENSANKPVLVLNTNTFPTVSISSPTNNAVFPAPTNLTISATAADADGTISNVQFFAGTVLLGIDTTSPYSIVWTIAPIGVWGLTARAMDNLGAVSTSAVVNITITTNLIAIADAHVVTTNVTKNFGTNTILEVQTNSTTITRDTYLKFSLASVTNISSAKLRLWANLSANGTVGTTVYPVSDTNWGETIITWSNKPPRGTSITSVNISGTTLAWYTVDVTSYVQSEKLAGRDLISLALHCQTNSTAFIKINSREASSNRVELLITVTNSAPVVAITTPTNNTVFRSPADIPITATASDIDGSISQVEFFQGATSLGVKTSPPYTVTWINAALGTNALTARAMDNWGRLSTSAVVNAIVELAPSVSLTAPANGALFPAYPTNITLTASASDSDGTVTKVEFFQGTNSLGIDNSSPYSITWSNVSGGVYGLTARATDNMGLVSTSSVNTITVDFVPTVTVTAPSSGSTFQVPSSIALTATASDSDGTVSKVDFYANGFWIGSSASAPFGVTWSNSIPGTFALTAVATDNLGGSGVSAAVYLTNTFSPTNLGGLKLWLNAGAGVTTNASGQVSVWADQSGTNNATQGTSANQPLWVANAVNGRPALRFDGTNDQLMLQTESVSNTFSLFVIARSFVGHELDVENNGSGYNSGGTGQHFLLGGVVNFNAYGEVGLSLGTNGVSVYEYGRNQIGSDHFAPLAVHEGALGANFQLIAIAYTNQYPLIYRNGGLVRSGLQSSRSGSVLGRKIGTTSSASEFSGDVAEILAYNRALTLDEQAEVIGYLNNKYGLYATPAAPPIVTADPISPTQVMVTWKQSGTNTLRSSVLERRQGTNSFSAIATMENRNVFLDTNVVANTDYTYRLSARDRAGIEEYSSEVLITTPATGTTLPAANLRLWLEAGNSHEVDRAGTWQDLLGTTNFAYQAITTNRPLVVNGTLNGYPVVQFDNTNSAYTLQNYTVSNNFTLVVVAQIGVSHEIDTETTDTYDTQGATGQHYLFSPPYFGHDFGEVGLSLGTNGISVYEGAYNTFFNNQFNPLAVWPGPVGANFNMITISYSNQQPSIYLNGAWVHTGLQSQRSGSVLGIFLGLNTFYGYSPFGGQVAEIMAFNGLLSPAEHALIAGYLNKRYTFVSPPQTPITLTARGLSSSEVALSWRQPGTNNLTTYVIERRLGTNGSFNVVAQVGADWRFIDSGLSSQTLYTYRVRNGLSSGTNGYSNEAQVQTLSGTTAFPLGDVALWLRAEDLAGPDGTAVGTWLDFLDQTRAATQANPPDQPTWAATGLNSLSAVQFSGGKYLQLPSVLSNASAAEVFVVLKSVTNAPAANQGLWKFNTNGASYFPSTSGGVQDAFGSTNARSIPAPLTDLTVPLIYDIAADTNLWRARMNGPVKQLLTTNTVAFNGTPLLGRSAQGAAEPFAGSIAEIIIFKRVLSLAEQKTVRDCLAQRFGVTLELPHIPSSLALVRTNTTDYRMSWAALVGSENGLESYFVVERRPDTNSSFLPLIALDRTNVLYLDPVILPEIDYGFRLRAANDVGDVYSSAFTAGLPDSDGDGLSDYLEGLLGTNPNSSDSDGDGLPDAWELKYGLNPRSAVGRDGAAGDFDNDGISNLLEYQQGTNPADGVIGEDPSIRLRVYRPN